MNSKYISLRQIDAEAKAVLERTRCYRYPVPVETVAYRLGLQVEKATLGDDVSGVLVIENGRGMIGYNEDQSKVRQRFSIAHELGHFQLHVEPSTISGLFIDKRYRPSIGKSYRKEFKRDDVSATGEKLQEIQANRFAAALLMPEDLIRRAIRNLEFDMDDDAAIVGLAEQFNVSTQAMSLRLSTLGLFDADE